MFSDKLQAIMKAKNITQSQIADHFGVSQSAVAKKFARNSWSAEEALRIFALMDCHLIVTLDDSALFKVM